MTAPSSDRFGLGRVWEDAEKEILRLRHVADHHRREGADLRCRLESVVRELEALRGKPADGAPAYPGFLWSSKFSWSGPFHLVAFKMVPYPDVSLGLPDVWEPAAKALCGEPWHGAASQWPLAVDVCVACVKRCQVVPAEPAQPSLFDSSSA